jgi:CDP-glycerol glycerophosphotransferase (TagB/SpsB family)
LPLHAPQKISSKRRFLLRAQRLARGVAVFAIYPLLSRKTRNGSRFAFGYQDGGFAGNTKYLYLWAHLNRPDLKVGWISHNGALVARLRALGLPAYRRWSLSGIWHTVRSAALFFDHSPSDVNVMLSKGSVLVNLWHGVGIKPIQFNDPKCVVSTHAKHRKNAVTRAIFIDYVLDPDVVVSTSEFTSRHFSDQFRISEERCPSLGYARLDCASDPQLKDFAISLESTPFAVTRWDEFAEHYIYLPTFRDTGRSFLQDALPDLATLSNSLRSRNAVLYIKLHPKSADQIGEEYDNIRAWPVGIDYYPVLSDFEICISDYSSVIFDYVAVTNAGAVTYTFDYDDYVEEDRSLLYTFDDCVPGPWIHTFEDLCRLLRDGTAVGRSSEQHERVKQLFWGGSCQPASPAVIAFVEQQVALRGMLPNRASTTWIGDGSEMPVTSGK